MWVIFPSGCRANAGLLEQVMIQIELEKSLSKHFRRAAQTS
jgi:hypothetical protein